MARTAVRSRPGGCGWGLRVPRMALGSRCAKRHRKGSRVQKGLVGVGLAALGSTSGQEQGMAGSCRDPFCSARERALLPDPSQTAQRAAPAPSPRPAPGESCPLVPPRLGGLFRKKEGPLSGLSGLVPRLPPRPSALFPRWPAAPALGTPNPALRARPSTAAPGPGFWVCPLFCDWSRALCQPLGPSS